MSAQRCTVIDLIGFGTQRTVTPEGYVIAPANIARTGIQLYSARELGLKDGDPNRTVRVYRPPGEVFHPDAIKSFEAKPIADNHPEDDITAENWEKYAVGDVHDVAPNGTHLGAQTIFRKKSAIAALDSGKTELSCGYSFDADMTPGRTGDGLPYDIVQRNIRGNHVALVDMARGGPGCRVADREPNEPTEGDTPMSTDQTLSTIRIAGVTLRVLATDAQAALDIEETRIKTQGERQTAIDKAAADLGAATKDVATLTARAVDTEAKLVKTNEENAKLKADAAASATAHDAAIKDLQGKIPTEAQLEERAALRADVVAGAKKLVGDSFDGKGKAVPAIRAEAVAHVIAKDASLKPIAKAILGETEPGKADEGKVRDTFAALVAAKGAVRANDGRGREELGRLLAHDDNGDRTTAADADVIDLSDPQATLKYRGNHGGKSVKEESAS